MGIRYTQPQYPVDIDRSNPLGAKVVYASTLAGGYAYDSVTKKLGVNTAAVRVATPRGTALKFDGSSSLITLPTTDLVAGYPLTVSCRFYKPSSVSRVIYSFNGSGFHAIAGFFSSGHLGVSADSSGNFYLPNGSIPSGLNDFIIVFYSGSYVLYLNGVAQTLTGGGSNWTQPAAGNNSIGARLGGSSLAYFSEAIQDLIVFNGELSADEARQVYLNPYQIFQPQNRRLWVAGSGTVWNVSISESVSLSEALSAIAGFQGVQSEALTLTESQSETNLAVVSASESIALADAPSSGVATGASISESLALAESLSASALFSASMTEALSLVEDVTSLLIAAASVAESVTLSDTPSAVAAFSVSTAESVTLADTSSTSGQVTSASVTESIALSDAETALTIFTASVAESVSLADTLLALAQLSVAMSEAISLVDSSSSTGQVVAAAISESIALTDTWSNTAALSAAIIEALALADTSQSGAQLGVVQVEALSLSDSPTARTTWTVAVSELMTLADVVNWAGNLVATPGYRIALAAQKRQVKLIETNWRASLPVSIRIVKTRKESS